MQELEEREMWEVNGFVALILVLAAVAFGIYLLIASGIPERGSIPSEGFILGLAILILSCSAFAGFFVVQPNEAKVFTFLGRYVGSARGAGFSWTNPLAKKMSISMRVRNFETDTMKVNDAQGNPIEIGAVIVWRVIDSAKALYNVQNYSDFVSVQSETSLRVLAGHFPYDSTDHTVESLRGSQDEVADELRKQLKDRLAQAGVEVDEARLSHLAYAPEIAQAMLRRQQAEAVIAARRLIVDGAVGMVKMALDDLESQGVVQLDNERRAAMVNNLLVSLVSENEAQPVINTGTLYS